MKKKLAMLLAATMLATLFTGCGAGGKEDKGELNLYTWDGMFPQEILDGFEVWRRSWILPGSALTII